MDVGTLPVDLAHIARSAGDAASERAAGRLTGTGDALAMRQAAEDFEAVFLGQMLAPMFAGLETNEYFGGGPGEDVYRSLLVEEYGKAIARSGGVGIADAVERELLRLQEVASP